MRKTNDDERTRLSNLDFRIAPFRKGTWKRFRVADGLPSGQVFRIMFASDGAAWVATAGGAARFDGQGFTSVSRAEGLPSYGVGGIAQDSDGVIWFGTGRGLARYYPPEIGFSSPAGQVEGRSKRMMVSEIRAATNGVLWVRSLTEVTRFEGAQETILTNIWPGTTYSFDPYMAVAPNGRLWFTGTKAGSVYVDGTNVTHLTTTNGLRSMDTGGVAVAPDGAIWFGDGPGCLSRYHGTNFVHFSVRDGVPAERINTVHAAPDGSIWFAAAQQDPCRFDGKSFVYFSGEDLARGSFREIQTGPDGATWLASGHGLYRFEENTLSHFSAADGLPETSEGTPLLAARDGTLWLGSSSNGLVRFDGRRFTTFDDQQILKSRRIIDLAQADDGTLWLATSNGLVQFDGARFLPPAPDLNLPVASPPTALAKAADGSIWVSTRDGGAGRFVGTHLAEWFSQTNGLPTKTIFTLRPDLHGGVWLGTGMGAVRFDGTNWRLFTEQDGLPNRLVMRIGLGPDGYPWFGNDSGGGPSRFDGRTIVPITGSKRIPGLVGQVFKDAQDLMWLATGDGVVRFDGICWSPLEDEGGLLSGSVSRIAQDSNGAMWFLSAAGLTRYRPIRTTLSAPAVSLQLDQLYHNVSNLPKIITGRLLTFRCRTIDFRTRPSRLLYRYALVPGNPDTAPAQKDPSWLAPETSTQFAWRTNRAGVYTFFAQTIDRDLNYSTPAAVHFEIVAPWYANAFIVVPSGGAALALVGWAFVARIMVARRKREAEQLREEMLEQERCAKQLLEREVAERKRSEQQLHDSEALYHSLVENLNQYIWRTDRQGRRTFANERYCQFWGVNLNELIGKTSFDYIVPRESAEEMHRADQHVIKTGETLDMVETVVHPATGKKIYLQLVKTPLRD